MTTQPTFADLPRREQNYARTRIALLDALAERLVDRSLEEIQVSELAEAADISQATFFNYFPSKTELLTYFIQVWSVEVAAVARRVEAEHDSALAAIEALLDHTAVVSGEYPNVMLETIAHQARMPVDLELPSVGVGERLLRLPDEPDVMSLPDTGLSGILPIWLGKAIERGELPRTADVRTLMAAVASVFFGIPLVVGRRSPHAIRPLYRRQLAIIWAGARALAKEGK